MPDSERLVVLDANILANIHVCDLFLRLAEEPVLYRPSWSEKILDEVQQTHAKLTWKEEISNHWREEVQRAFPDSMISDFEGLEDQIEVDSKDRHVAAAAVKGGAQLIVTFNLKDFPSVGLEPWHLEVVHPAKFLIWLHESHSKQVHQRLGEFAAKRGCSVNELVDRLSEWLGEFTEVVRAD